MRNAALPDFIGSSIFFSISSSYTRSFRCRVFPQYIFLKQMLQITKIAQKKFSIFFPRMSEVSSKPFWTSPDHIKINVVELSTFSLPKIMKPLCGVVFQNLRITFDFHVSSRRYTTFPQYYSEKRLAKYSFT